MSQHPNRAISILLILATLVFGLQATGAHAGMFATDALAGQPSADANRSEIDALLASAELQRELVALGVDPQAAAERIQALTPAEMQLLHERIDELPAGAGAAGVAVIVLLVLVFLDIFGVTDIFTFINPAK